jgi:hypothetical protein
MTQRKFSSPAKKLLGKLYDQYELGKRPTVVEKVLILRTLQPKLVIPSVRTFTQELIAREIWLITVSLGLPISSFAQKKVK